LVIECGPEHLATKQSIFADLLAKTGDDTVLATASSAIQMSRIVTNEGHQARCLVAHPVNPPAVLRIVELCPAPGTTSRTMIRTADLFGAVGFRTAALGHEVEGFILNRLQGAVLREAYRLVSEGVADPDDIDAVMRLGLGPRWALSGPFETVELNTSGGITAHADRMGPAYKRMGEERGETVDWNAPLIARVAASREASRGGVSIEDRARWRSRAVARLVGFRDGLMDEADG
jgi:3-hydroxyacyl-CoA dehydrogenase